MEESCRCDDKNLQSFQDHKSMNRHCDSVAQTSKFQTIYRTYQTKPHENSRILQPLTNPISILNRYIGIKSVHAQSQTQDASQQKENVETGSTPPLLQLFAQTYIQKETGMDRLKLIYKRDHEFRVSQEARLLVECSIQSWAFAFILKYIPTWYQTKRDFVKKHQATVFRTKIQAMRLQSDTILQVSIRESGKFAAKIGTFTTLILFLSQTIASYRNKSSPLEYGVAGAVTGGLFRIPMGMRGMIAGSVLAGLMGTIAGCVVTVGMKMANLTQEERHLEAIMDRLIMERSIVGEKEFLNKMKALMEGPDQVELMANKREQ